MNRRLHQFLRYRVIHEVEDRIALHWNPSSLANRQLLDHTTSGLPERWGVAHDQGGLSREARRFG
jgi:hypothetical protein